ncbi:MAG TPA: cytochrome c oxidase assembly protein [Streptosporangiaceae bacterium]|jgi:putative copper resistance protein D
MLPPFGLHSVVSQWQFAPVVTVSVVIAAGLYLWGVVRVSRRHPARPWPAWRTGMFLAGLAVIVISTQSGIGAYDDVLFWDHMIQHLLLIMLAPALLIFAQPITLLLHASRNPLHTWTKRAVRSRVASFLTWPLLGALAYTAAVAGAHLTSLANVIEDNQTLHDTEHIAFLVIGYLFFLPLLGREPIRWRLSYPMRFFILILLMPVDTFTGLVLGYGNAGTPGVPAGPRPAWAPAPVQDLHAGGAVMWIGGDAVMFGFMMLVFLMWSMDERADRVGHGWLETARRTSMASLVSSHHAASHGTSEPGAGDGGTPGQQPGTQPAGAAATDWHGRGGIDDDEHLAAYNAFLARLNDAETRRQ